MRTPAARLIWERIAPAFRECVRPQQPFALLAIAGLTTATAPRASRPLCKQCSAWQQSQITSSNVQVTYVRRDDAGYVGQTSRPLTIEVSLQGLSYRWTFLPFSPAPLRSTTASISEEMHRQIEAAQTDIKKQVKQANEQLALTNEYPGRRDNTRST